MKDNEAEVTVTLERHNQLLEYEDLIDSNGCVLLEETTLIPFYGSRMPPYNYTARTVLTNDEAIKKLLKTIDDLQKLVTDSNNDNARGFYEATHKLSRRELKRFITNLKPKES